jgi:hypothetical protein
VLQVRPDRLVEYREAGWDDYSLSLRDEAMTPLEEVLHLA